MGSSPTKQASKGGVGTPLATDGSEGSSGARSPLSAPAPSDEIGDEPVVLHGVSGSREERLADGDGKALDRERHELLIATHAHLLEVGKDVVAAKAYARALEVIDADGRAMLESMSPRARECMFGTLLSETMIIEHNAKSVAMIRRIAAVHVGKKLRYAHFDAVLNALLLTCAEVVGEASWSAEVAEAYRHEFESISNMMKAAMTDASPAEFNDDPALATPHRAMKKRRSRVSFSSLGSDVVEDASAGGGGGGDHHPRHSSHQ